MVVDAWQSDRHCYTGLRPGLDTDTQNCFSTVSLFLLSNVAPLMDLSLKNLCSHKMRKRKCKFAGIKTCLHL